MADTRLMDELQSQLQGMRKLLVSEEWILWANFLKKERKGYLQNKVNNCVRERRFDDAAIALALMDDCLRQVDLFSKHIKNTDEKLNQKEKP